MLQIVVVEEYGYEKYLVRTNLEISKSIERRSNDAKIMCDILCIDKWLALTRDCNTDMERELECE